MVESAWPYNLFCFWHGEYKRSLAANQKEYPIKGLLLLYEFLVRRRQIKCLEYFGKQNIYILPSFLLAEN